MTRGMRIIDHPEMEPVPWPILVPHELQAQKNHRQSLRRLAERGGLAPSEMVAVLEDRPFRPMDDVEARDRLSEIIRAETAKLE